MYAVALQSELTRPLTIPKIESGTDISDYLGPYKHQFPKFNHRLFFVNDESPNILFHLPTSDPKLSLCLPARFFDNDYYEEVGAIGFNVIGSDTTLIKLMQGVNGGYVDFKPQEFLPRDFGGTAVGIMCDFAYDFGISTVRIRRAEDDLYYHDPWDVPLKEIPALQARMRKRYDGTAERLGFTLNSDGVFEKRI